MNLILELENITKIYPGVVANSNINLSIEKGEIHAIAGENGAGKSTLMNIVYGLVKADKGIIKLAGKEVNFEGSRDAIHAGIGMVHQHFMLIDRLTVTENIILGQEVGTFYKLDRKKASEEIRSLSEKYGLLINPDEIVGNLSVTMRQRVEILKVLYRRAELLIFDEPTAVLTPQEIKELCGMLKNLTKMGKTIIFISHKLLEVMDVSDRITVIRNGKVINTLKTAETDPKELTYLMVGREVHMGGGVREAQTSSSTVMEFENVCFEDQNVRKLHNINFQLKQGEILGIAGVDGNGQEEIVDIIRGILKVSSGTVRYLGENHQNLSIQALKQKGLAIIPEDRHRDAIIEDSSIPGNLILGYHEEAKFIKHKHFHDHKAIRENAENLKDIYDIKIGVLDSDIGTLSGGNQQKVVIAREVSSAPNMILAVQPTRGLDVGAIEFIHKVLVDERNKGRSVLLFSLELEEILQLSDRIAVVYKGEIVGIVENKGISREKLGFMMLGTTEKAS